MQVLQVLIGGVAQGCIYGLIALGFVLIYKATETVSFAQGDLMMLGAFLGLGVIAEGVETASQRDFLARSGCHAYQGYFFSRPLPLEGFENFMR